MGRTVAAGDVETARAQLRARRKRVAFTGAGVSTASGVTDYRSPGGIWSRSQPVLYQEFLESEDARRRYWRFRREGYREMLGARPNVVHELLARMEAEGSLVGVITQNIDGLHQDAGSRNVLELHGTSRRIECLSCGAEHAPAEVCARIDGGEDLPGCVRCGGVLKAATVSFGQPMPEDVLDAAFRWARECDAMLVLGSSLVVQPAAGIPLAAAESGAAVIIVNREPTPLDPVATAVLRGEVQDILPALVS